MFYKNPNIRMMLGWCYRAHVIGLFAILKSIYANKKLTGKYFSMKVFLYPGMNVVMDIDNNCNVNIKGRLIVKPWMGRNGNLFIKVSKNATFDLLSDLYCGPNVHLYVNENAKLHIAGSDDRISTITADSKILVYSEINIGLGTIIAWDCCITDSDWHKINGKVGVKSVTIGDHVWLANGVTVLKGANISDDSIIASKSVVNKPINNPYSLSAGIPAVIVKNAITWQY